MINKRELNPGMRICFFGTNYVIHKVVDYDVVDVIQNNGIKVTLWFPDLPGRTVLN